MAACSVNDSNMNSQTNRSVKIKIIHSACLLFKQRGYFGVSINDVAEQTGISKSTVYHYFRSKNELVLSAIALEAEKLKATWGTLQNSAKLPLEEQLSLLSTELRNYFVTNNGNLIITLAHELEGVSDDISNAIRQVFDSWRTELETLLHTHAQLIKKQARELASLLIVKIFGGVLLSKVYQDHSFINDACTLDTMAPLETV